MQRNGGAASVAGVRPLLLAKRPVESLSPPSNNQSVSQTFAPIFHKLRIWGKSFKEKMLLYFRDVKSKTECSHSTLCFWPSQAGSPPSVRHSQWALKAVLPTRWDWDTLSPEAPQGTAGLNNLLSTLLLTLAPTPALAMSRRVGMGPNCCPQQVIDEYCISLYKWPMQEAVSRRKAT